MDQKALRLEIVPTSLVQPDRLESRMKVIPPCVSRFSWAEDAANSMWGRSAYRTRGVME
jgi:hypothetical protein